MYIKPLMKLLTVNKRRKKFPIKFSLAVKYNVSKRRGFQLGSWVRCFLIQQRKKARVNLSMFKLLNIYILLELIENIK